MSDTKGDIQPAEARSSSPDVGFSKETETERHEVFKKTADGVDFRTVGWPRATVIFLKITFALGVLAIPTALYSLGAVGGALSLVAWSSLNTYLAVVQGNFRNNHPECHTIADMCGLMGRTVGGPVGGTIAREVAGAIFLVAYVLCIGGGVIGLSVAFNALSDHSICTVWFAFIGMILMTAAASVRTLRNVGWLTWVGFFSLVIAVLIVVIGVTTRSRPAAAPQEGDFDLGYRVIANPTFIAGITATATIFISSAGTSAMLPVISEMRQPRDYKKAVIVCNALCLAMYLAFALVLYAYCGQYIATPALGSAGSLLKKVSYGVALPGLIVTGAIYQHVAAKYLFVRILRNSVHLQSNTFIHWATWLSCCLALGIVSFLLAEAVAIFNYILALAGAICFGPMALITPGLLYIHDSWHYKNGTALERTKFYAHIGVILLGIFITIGGTYGAIMSIIEAYAAGVVGRPFDCADNSGTIA
ncbi:hypothetical protein GQ53DRAFT_658937 [Thozetella sp. PMI_491]|nr:hypothetical protein GQ53DRAFT_658937 [Thozetella sp. PMI_491]